MTELSTPVRLILVVIVLLIVWASRLLTVPP
jgi:hypothetical protein